MINKRHILSPHHIPCPMSALQYKKLVIKASYKISYGCF